MNETCVCSCCGNEQDHSEFYTSHCGMFTYTKHLPVCKTCLSRLFKVYSDGYRDSKKAIKKFCMMFDLYYSDSIYNACINEQKNGTNVVGNYIRKLNMNQYRSKSFDTSLTEGFVFDEETERAIASKRKLEMWGHGFTEIDYEIMDEHYKFLKAANPKSINDNQEIFIKDLCYTKMQQMRAIREGEVDNFNKLTESYRKTFNMSGLKTEQESENSDNDCWGVWTSRISQYTPEEYYKDKNLYKDYDGLGDYIDRHLLRPIKNVLFGSRIRDAEYQVEDSGDYDES